MPLNTQQHADLQEFIAYSSDEHKSQLRAAYLNSPEWKELSEQAKKRDGYCCVVCCSTKELNVHHRCYPDIWGTEPLSYLTTLCRICHNRHHHQDKTNTDSNALKRSNILSFVGENKDTTVYRLRPKRNPQRNPPEEIQSKYPSINSIDLTIWEIINTANEQKQFIFTNEMIAQDYYISEAQVNAALNKLVNNSHMYIQLQPSNDHRKLITTFPIRTAVKQYKNGNTYLTIHKSDTFKVCNDWEGLSL